MKRKLIFALFILLLMASFAWADGYEAVTVAGTSIGLTPATYGRSRAALCRVETGPIRYVISSGTTPTDAVGIPLFPLEWVILENQNQIRNFRAIRTTATSASLKCFYFD